MVIFCLAPVTSRQISKFTLKKLLILLILPQISTLKSKWQLFFYFLFCVSCGVSLILLSSESWNCFAWVGFALGGRGWEWGVGLTKVVISPNIGLDHVQANPDYNFKNTINDDEENDTPYSNVGHFCEYFEEEDFTYKFKDISKQISTFSNNIRSLTGKWDDFSSLITNLNKNKFKFSVVAIQEVWNVPPNTDFSLADYRPFHYTIRDSSGMNANAGGGVGLWVNKNFEYEPIKDISIFEPHIFESQFIKLKTSKNKFIIIGNIYRPNTAPKADLQRFNDILENILDKISSDPDLKKADDVQLVGDVNIDLLQYKHHNHTATYIDNLISHGQLPLITLPTRITPTSATVLDHISTSHRSDRYDSGIIQSSLSDHLPVFYVKHANVSSPPPKYTKTRKVNTNTIPAFENLLRSANWDIVTNENRPKQAFESFFETLDNCVNIAFPEVTTKVNLNSSPLCEWMTLGLLVSRAKKEKLFSKKLRKRTPENIDIFKNHNKFITKFAELQKNFFTIQNFLNFPLICVKPGIQ